MKLKISFAAAMIVLFVLPMSAVSVSSGVELARVGDEVITSEEFLEDFRIASYDRLPPERTQEGKKEFLDRLIYKHLLSRYFKSRGWDTLHVWDDLIIKPYEESIYIQALYQDAIPEVREPWKTDASGLVELGRQFADSLVTAYKLWVSNEAITLLAEKSMVPEKEALARKEEGEEGTKAAHVHTDEPGHEHERAVFSWSELFTDEEKQVVVATFLGGAVTVGDFAEGVDDMPAMVRPIGGDTEQIIVTAQHFGQQEIVRCEFEKRNLRDQDWFQKRMKNKRESVMGTQMFVQMVDTSVVTEEEARAFYEEHLDFYRTVPLIKLATIIVGSEEIARRIEEKISEGEEFESVALDFSVYTASETGFDTTGLVGKDRYPALFEALWEKDVGTVSGALPQGEGWIIGKLLVRQDPRLLSFEEAKPRVVSRLRQQKADEALERLLEELRTTVGVETYPEALEALELPEW
ncbi:MAG: hypothetical protein AMJ46_00870 [Latescibacteria bacterium DG_63]|nr:MAG: hypothetical protein AMJ46_00870 [Latescibacteria bacterium DG_63]